MSELQPRTAGNSFIANMSTEQRAAALAKARETKVANAAFREANKHKLKLHYLDSGHWAKLASDYGVRMPSNEEPIDTTTLRKYLKRGGVEVEKFNEHYTSMTYFVKANPLWTKYAGAGLILELWEEA